MHVGSRVPQFLLPLIPPDALIIEEEAWTAFPYVKTVERNLWLKTRFELTIESFYAPGFCTLDNVYFYRSFCLTYQMTTRRSTSRMRNWNPVLLI